MFGMIFLMVVLGYLGVVNFAEVAEGLPAVKSILHTPNYLESRDILLVRSFQLLLSFFFSTCSLLCLREVVKDVIHTPEKKIG